MLPAARGNFHNAMRILLFNYHGNKPNPVYDVLAQALRKRGHEVIVATRDAQGSFSWRGPAAADLLTTAVDAPPPEWARKLPLPPGLAARWNSYRFLMAARGIINELRPDIIQVNTTEAPWMLAKRLPQGSHAVLDIRQINEAVNTKWRSRVREKLNRAYGRFWTRTLFEHSFFCHSEAAKHIVGEDWPVFASVIPVGVDNQFLDFPDEKLARPEEDAIVRFVYIGSLSHLRNLDRLIRAAGVLRREKAAFHLTIAGPDYTNGYFQAIIDEHDLGEFVSIHPPLAYEEIPPFLARHHVGLAYVPDRPTWHYQPTIKIMEYRALGLPILSTDVKSHRKFVEEGVNGVMVQDNVEAIAAGMLKLMQTPETLQEYSRSARQMRAGQTWDEVAGMYEDAYRLLTGRDKEPGRATARAPQNALPKGDPSET